MTPIGNTSSLLKRGAWTAKEDALLKNYIQKFGEGKWHLVPLRAGLNRCRKSCRLRWLNYLRPNIKRGDFEKDEVDLIHRLHMLLGNKWSLIAGRIPGRTGNDVKNYWNTHVRSRTKRQEEEIKQSEPRQNKKLKKDQSTQHEVVRAIKPQAHTISKTFNMYPQITPRDKGKKIIPLNDGFNILPEFVSPPLTISDYKIDEYLDKLFEDSEKEMNEEIGQENGENHLFDFPIDDVFWSVFD